MDIETLNWYGVKLLYVNKVAGEPDTKLVNDNYLDGYLAYEESIIVILGNSFDTAYQKAERIAKGNEDNYPNIYGQTIQVRYSGAVDCYLMEEAQEVPLQEGVEVYSRLIESNISEDPKAFLQRVIQ